MVSKKTNMKKIIFDEQNINGKIVSLCLLRNC